MPDHQSPTPTERRDPVVPALIPPELGRVLVEARAAVLANNANELADAMRRLVEWVARGTVPPPCHLRPEEEPPW